MATTINQTRLQEGLCVVNITATLQNDVVPFNMPRCSAISAQLTGTIGAANVSIECSNDGTNYVALPTAVVFAATGVKSIAPADLGFKYYRTNVTTGAPGGTLTLTIVGMEQR